nr:MAG TPA: hypothetical protein [Caudoviricetes sp.]
MAWFRYSYLRSIPLVEACMRALQSEQISALGLAQNRRLSLI